MADILFDLYVSTIKKTNHLYSYFSSDKTKALVIDNHRDDKPGSETEMESSTLVL